MSDDETFGIRGEIDPPENSVWANRGCKIAIMNLEFWTMDGTANPSRARITRMRARRRGGWSGADGAEALEFDLRGASPRTGRDKGEGANASEALARGRNGGGAGYKMAATAGGQVIHSSWYATGTPSFRQTRIVCPVPPFIGSAGLT